MNYIIGKIVYINNRYLIIENSFIGHLIFITNSKEYEINKYKKIFISEKILIQNNHLNKELYGFVTFKEKVLFEKFMKINGIGPKTAMQILACGIDQIKKWIINKDLNNFKAVKGLSTKLINLIFSEIKVTNDNQIVQKIDNLDEAVEALKSLGYSSHQIQASVNSIEEKQLSLDQENSLSTLIASLIKNINEHQTT